MARNVAAGRLNFRRVAESVANRGGFHRSWHANRRGDGHADLSYVYAAAEEVAQHLDGYTVIVTKSTVPVGTGREVFNIVKKINPAAEFDVASNPNFFVKGQPLMTLCARPCCGGG